MVERRDDDDYDDGDDDFFMRRRRLSPLKWSCPSRAVLGTTIVSSRVIKIPVAGHTSPTRAGTKGCTHSTKISGLVLIERHRVEPTKQVENWLDPLMAMSMAMPAMATVRAAATIATMATATNTTMTTTTFSCDDGDSIYGACKSS